MEADCGSLLRERSLPQQKSEHAQKHVAAGHMASAVRKQEWAIKPKTLPPGIPLPSPEVL